MSPGNPDMAADPVTHSFCPVCGSALPRSSPGSLCPACLVAGVFEDADDEPQELAGNRFGPYRILEPAGEGGYGIVYRAEREHPVRHTLALKVLKPGRDDEETRRRFEREALLLASLRHPNIATLYDSGSLPDGRSYLALEWIEGQAVTHYCDSRRLPAADRLQLFAQVCRAVHHAHQKGVVHRDLKPSNILVTEKDGRPVAKIIDFGIARLIAPVTMAATSLSGSPLGTLPYMSPEQAGEHPEAVDTRSDVYSLGVLLYELLTGTTPLRAEDLATATPIEVQRLLVESDPERPSTRISSLGASSTSIAELRHTDPSTLRRSLRGDLDWIVLKALAKDRNGRYHSADSLAEDIEHHLHNEPITAGSPTAFYLARKFIRRHKAAVFAAAACLALLAGAGAVSTLAWLRADALQQRLAIQKNTLEHRTREAETRRTQAETLATTLVGTLEGRLRRAGRSTLLQAVIDRVESHPGTPSETSISSDSGISGVVTLASALVDLQAGNLDRARTHIEDVVRIRERALSRQLDSQAHAHGLAEAAFFHALILDDLGESPAARRSLTRAESLLAGAPQIPVRPAAWIDRALALCEQARIALEMEDENNADACLRRAADLLASLTAETPDAAGARALWLRQSAALALRRGDAQTASEEADAACWILLTDSSDRPADASLRRQASLALWQRAQASASKAAISIDLEPALVDLLDAETILTGLIERGDAPLAWRAGLIDLQRYRAQLLSRAGRLEEASDTAGRALRSIDPYPSHPAWVTRWARLHAELLATHGSIVSSLGNPNEGVDYLTKALETVSRASAPLRERLLNLELTASLQSRLGDLLLRAGLSEEALEAVDSALAALEIRSRAAPPSRSQRAKVSRIWLRAALVADACGKHDLAFARARKALDASHTIQPDSAGDQDPDLESAKAAAHFFLSKSIEKHRPWAKDSATPHLEEAERILLALADTARLTTDSGAMLLEIQRSRALSEGDALPPEQADPFPTQPEAGRALEEARLGGNALGKRNLKEAENHLNTAAHILDDLLTTHPGQPPAALLRTRADVHTDIAALFRQARLFDSAFENHRAAFRLRSQLWGRESTTRTATDRAYDRIELADTYGALGRSRQSEAELHQARLELESLRAEAGGLPGGELVELLGIATHKLAISARNRGDLHEAERWANQAVQTRKSLFRLEDKKIRWYTYLAQSLALLGEIFSEMRETEKGTLCFETSTTILQRLADAGITTSSFREELVRVRLLEARARISAGRGADAAASLRAAEPHLGALIAFANQANSPQSSAAPDEVAFAIQRQPDWNRLLADFRLLQGICLPDTGSAATEDALREALALSQSLGHHRASAEALSALGEIALKQQDAAAARESFQQAIDAWRSLAAARQKSAQATFRLAEALSRLAACPAGPEEAGESAQRSRPLELVEEAVSLLLPAALRSPVPSTLGALRDTFLLRGELQDTAGSFEEALASRALAAGLATRLVHLQPGNPMHQETRDAAHDALLEAGSKILTANPARGTALLKVIKARIAREKQRSSPHSTGLEAKPHQKNELPASPPPPEAVEPH